MAAWDKKILWAVMLVLTGALGQRVNYPGPVCGVKGSTVLLPCSFTPLKSVSGGEVLIEIIRVVWCQNHLICHRTTPSVYDSKSNNNDRRYRYLGDKKGNCTLQISDLQKKDEATFRFRMEANDQRGHFTDQSGVRVTVVDQMKIRSSRDDGEFKRGEAVTLNCSAESCTIHQLEVTWFRDGHALSETGPALQLTNLTAKDCGNYTCGLKKNNRSLSVPYSLHVEQDQMKIRSSRDDGEFKRGEAVTLNCSAESCTIHQLEVTWFRDGHALSETGPALHLTNLTAEDSGNYTCGLKNNNRSLSVPYSLHVEADEEGGRGKLPLIVGLVVGVLLVLFAVILVVCIIKRKRAAGRDQTAVGLDGEQKHSDNIYSNDFLPPAEQQGPSNAVEEVSYASVQFKHKKQARPAEEVEDAIIYSSVARTG